MTGTLVNAAAIVVGAGLGTLLGGRLTASIRSTVTDVLGVFVLALGASDAFGAFGGELEQELGTAAVLVILGSLLVGGVLGELLDIEGRLERFGGWLRDRVVRGGPDPDAVGSGPSARPASADTTGQADPAAPAGSAAHVDPPDLLDPRQRFVEGFVVTSLIVCVGPLAILGALQDGLTDSFQLLAVKSMLDGFAALAFASALGIGVAFSVLPLMALQGSVTLAAGALQSVMTEPMLAALTATGGFLVMAIGIRLLELRRVRVANLLPALLLAPLLVAVWPG
ncbi:MAG: DUF554 domain-containing protein [Nitriliruptoraceae bacterium]